MRRPYVWKMCMNVHSDLFSLGLSHTEIMVYTYLSAHCQRDYPISITIMANVLAVNTHKAKLAVDALIDRRMVTKQARKGCASVLRVTSMLDDSWGESRSIPSAGQHYPPAPTQHYPLLPDSTGTYSQSAPLPTNLKERDHDALFLHVFTERFTKWQFNRKPIGKHFVFTNGMKCKAIYCMRALFNMAGFSTPQDFERFLDHCGEYLSLPRDVLSPNGRDQRALSPGKWLNDWPEQIRLAGIYADEKARKITRIEEGIPPDTSSFGPE